ncbi:MAG: FtsQ-type POTRA domain-containing protein [Aromatoleum sp.]|nr:FtsQ-type POTRA domain-containing protein [Aromatoleum sp.]
MWDDPRQLNAAALWVALIAAALLAWSGFAWLARQPAFAFREVVVRGPLERTNAAHLEAVIRDELSGTFFTMGMERARASLSRVPWVRNVALRRHWPQRLEVTVEEHAPLARWNEAALVNAQGEVFAADYAGELPSFFGADGSATEVARRYREWGEALAPLALSVREVKLSPRGGWQLKANGESGPLDIELGREEPSARLARFVAVWGRTVEALAKAGTRIGHVDLRYRNGFAARVPGFTERPQKKGATQSRKEAPRSPLAPVDVHGDASGNARLAMSEPGDVSEW